MGQIRSSKTRRDGWTPERQLRFLDVLAATRSITKAAASANISRESAYRLCKRKDGVCSRSPGSALLKARSGEFDLSKVTRVSALRSPAGETRRNFPHKCVEDHETDEVDAPPSPGAAQLQL